MEPEIHANRLKTLNGVFFPNHAKLRGNLDPRKMEILERKIVDLQPDFYFDRKHENYQAHIGDTVVPFELRLHDSKPGTIAIAKTVIPHGGQSIDMDRITPLHVGMKQGGCLVCQALEEAENS